MEAADDDLGRPLEPLGPNEFAVIEAHIVDQAPKQPDNHQEQCRIVQHRVKQPLGIDLCPDHPSCHGVPAALVVDSAEHVFEFAGRRLAENGRLCGHPVHQAPSHGGQCHRSAIGFGDGRNNNRRRRRGRSKSGCCGAIGVGSCRTVRRCWRGWQTLFQYLHAFGQTVLVQNGYALALALLELYR